MTTQLIDRSRAIVDDGSMSRAGRARAAGLHANSLRDLESPGWNPTAETLRKLETWLAHGSDLSPMASAEEIIAEARNGRMVILVDDEDRERSEEHTSELQSLMRISYAVFCLKKNKKIHYTKNEHHTHNK